MKKIIIALSIISIVISNVKAQDKIIKSSKPLQLSFGIDAGYPIGENRRVTFIPFGGDAQVAYNSSENFSFLGSAGFDVWIGRGSNPSLNYAPVLGGFRYYFGNVFLSEQAGYSIGVSKNLKGALTNVIGIGYNLSKTSDILLNYKRLFYSGTANTDLSCLGLRISYNFGK